jgi:hypothetical protein
MPNLAEEEVTAVKTWVSPYLTVVAPLACRAIFPVSMVKVLPAISFSTFAVIFFFVSSTANTEYFLPATSWNPG